MTVCVATIARGGAIIGASDRLLSTHEFKYEAPGSKMYGFTGRSLVALWAGNSSVTSELLQDFSVRVVEKLARDALISDIVSAYAECYHVLFDKRVSRRYLRRHGLTLANLRAGKHKLSDSTVERLEGEIDAYWMEEGVGLLIAGRDRFGAHLWRVVNGEAHCADMEGFATIGTGGAAALASLRSTGFSAKRTQNEALLLTYLAKKRGEQSPTVGATTDMCLVFRGQAEALGREVIAELDAAYKDIVERESEAIRAGTGRIEGSMSTLVAQWQAMVQAADAASSSSATSSDKDQT